MRTRLTHRWRSASPFAAALAFALTLGSASVYAQPAGADVLFDQGRALMDAKRYAEAAEKFEESYSLDPAIGTQLNLAECYVNLGRTASAWTTYRAAAAAAAQAGQRERERYASGKAKALESKLSRMTVAVGQPVEGLVVKRNGVDVPPALWGTAVPTDPGPVTIEASAPGYEPWSTQIDLGKEADKQEVSVPVLTAKPLPPEEGPQGPPPNPELGGSLTSEPKGETGDAGALPPPEQSGGFNAAGWITFGVGVLGVGVGTFLYLESQSKIDDANCPNSQCVVGIGDKDLHDSGRAEEKTAFILGGLSLAVTGVGVYLLLSDDAGDEAASLRRTNSAWYRGLSFGSDGRTTAASWRTAF
ncbi:MAG: tetratricopeptide repeat protein [Polyangiaceae bacterium]